jgi:fructose-1-phosphate kinase PfkB-like protein
MARIQERPPPARPPSAATRVLVAIALIAPLLRPVAGFSAPVAMAMDFAGRQQGLDWLDNTGGLWQLPAKLVPLPHERLRLAQALEQAQLPGAGRTGPLSAPEAHATFLPLWQTLGELRREARLQERRCIVGVSGGECAAEFAHLLAAVLGQESACEWAPLLPCAVVGTAGYLSGDDAAKEPLAGPDAYDCARLAADIAELRSQPGIAAMSASESQDLVLVHGPHVLRREGAWSVLDGQFDLTVDLQTSDDKPAGGQGGDDDAAAPPDVQSRILAARLELSQWEGRAPVDLSLRFQEQADGSVLFIPETLSIAPARRRKPALLAVGLNPSYQKSLQMAALQVGEVNRADKLTISAGGKGQHFALAANRLGKGSAAVAHFLGRKGEEGQKLYDALEAAGVAQEVQWHGGVTRTCTTILEDGGRMTEVIEPSDAIPRADVDALLSRLRESVQGSKGVALCGTFPPGVKEEVYAGIAASVGDDTVLLLDGWKGVEETLATKRVNILKINADELRWLTGEADLDAGAAVAMARHMAPGALLAVTRGPSSALLYSAADGGDIVVTEFDIEEVRALNPIGAGDTCSSVLLYGVCAGYSAPDAFAFALAAASGEMRCVRAERARRESHAEGCVVVREKGRGRKEGGAARVSVCAGVCRPGASGVATPLSHTRSRSLARARSSRYCQD